MYKHTPNISWLLNIYKAYFLSNNWTSHYDIYHIFKYEFKLICHY